MENKGQQRGLKSEFEGYLLSGGAAELLEHTPCKYVAPVPLELGNQAFITYVPESTTAMMRMLVESIVDEVVDPILHGDSREACLRVVQAKWHVFCETLSTFHVLLARTSSEEKARMFAERAARSASDEIRGAARELAGEDGEAEADFAIATYRSGLRVVAVFEALPLISDESCGRDRSLAHTFSTGAALHVMGAMLVASAARSRATQHGIALGFELLRAGALQVYSAAREAHDLRVVDESFESTDEEIDADPLLHPAPEHTAAR